MEEEKLAEIEKQIGIIVKLLSIRLLEGKSKTEAIEMLGAAGLDRVTISKVVGVKPNVVSVRLSEAKKKPKPKGSTKKEE
jgi:hypothetical protein